MNKCVFIGNLTKDPEGGSTTSGISYSKFTIAVNRRYTDSNGDRITDFIPVTAWRGLADNCNKYLIKGNKIAVEGQLNVSTYENDKGERRTKFDISADTVEFLSPRNEDKQPAEDKHTATVADKSENKKFTDLKEAEDAEVKFGDKLSPFIIKAKCGETNNWQVVLPARGDVE